MARERTGYTGQDKHGRWFYRYQYTDASGKRLNIRRLASSESRAKIALRKALDKLEIVGDSVVEGERLRFRDLAKTYAAHSIVPARYIGDRKIAGRRSIAPVEIALAVLREHFANRLIKDIKHHDLELFKLKRLDTPKSNDEERSIASVHRELELMRAIMRFAVRRGWLMRSPFEMGPPLISKSDETSRERVLSRDEENRLLAQCIGRRAHLRPLLIAALDTAMRRGELFKLTWEDVDLTRGVITIRAVNSKTARARTVASRHACTRNSRGSGSNRRCDAS
jgi:integrase